MAKSSVKNLIFIQLHSEYKGGNARLANVCSTNLSKTLPKEPEKQSTMKLFMQ